MIVWKREEGKLPTYQIITWCVLLKGKLTVLAECESEFQALDEKRYLLAAGMLECMMTVVKRTDEPLFDDTYQALRPGP